MLTVSVAARVVRMLRHLPVHRAWFIPSIISMWALIQGQHLEAIYLILLAILTTQSDYFDSAGGDTDGSE